ncbi:N-acetylmuramic acid 6-phosphate etherase [Paramicrobacterium humi]|uniref:N-acetylmuramic acid 6-phosphate etherase n=1 Tax=Paramicrobacterium humi TaxID=640635 RepID=A0A1H4JBX4_9MICO|nr:N-acetylmuramic acid 6-phosphate etherase [Microbacterium humi]SEB43824.1 N-acetylmuramic acid 6-phosphate etherase [Microbacterium humi]
MSDATRDGLERTLAGLATERVNARYRDLDLLTTPELVAAMNELDRGVADAVATASAEIARAVDGIAERMARGGRLIYVGAGTPGRLGVLDASEIPPTFGTEPDRVVGLIAGGDAAIRTAIEGAEDDADAGRAAVHELAIGEDDSVVGISASGRTPYVVAAVAEARRRGALTIGVACNSGSELGRTAKVAIEVEVGPELVTGSTRLKAGTAQKMVLNMLSTLTMVRLGKTYGNLMVDVRITNEKLRARAERTVRQATDADAETAARTLDAAGGSVKTAILALLADCPVPDAAAALETADGRIRVALERLGAASR